MGKKVNQAGSAHKPTLRCPVGGVAPLDIRALCYERRLVKMLVNSREDVKGIGLIGLIRPIIPERNTECQVH